MKIDLAERGWEDVGLIYLYRDGEHSNTVMNLRFRNVRNFLPSGGTVRY
jgi:hypothetical protein